MVFITKRLSARKLFHPVSLAEDLSSRLQNNQTKKKQKLGKGTVVGEEKKKVQFVNFTEKHIASEKKQNTVEFVCEFQKNHFAGVAKNTVEFV